jgi:NSS family neurotransmitter:Na+ symporter
MPRGRLIGYLLFRTVFMAESYYTLVVGQVLFYTVEVAFVGASGADPSGFFQRTLTGITPWNLAATAVTFLAVAFVIHLGVRKGIESISRVVMPLVFLSLVALIGRSMTLPGAIEGIRFFLLPDLTKVSGETFLAALGQVFFSLCLGGTFFLLYGSYLRPDENIPVTAVQTALGDLSAALLGGLAILPAVFAMGVAPAAGPSLLFITLPGVFGAMPGGSLVGGIFFAALFGAAFLSAVAAMEVIVDRFRHYSGWSRDRSLVLLVTLNFLLSLPSMASSDQKPDRC